ncbi:MAG: hypothetical protein COA66_03995 [Arcobacter sp.]|nr:MAG: hypothetical protein COA66_03995 [Arcobacter sp.]
MKKNFTARLIILSIFFIIISVFFLTVYNIYVFNEYKEMLIKKETKRYINKQKNIIEGKVKFITSIFEAKSLDLEDMLKEKIKTRINNAVILSNKIIDEYKDKTTSAELKLMLINIFQNVKYKNKNEYIFITDINTERILVHANKRILGKKVSGLSQIELNELRSLKDSDGIFHKIRFPKPSGIDKKYEKLIYLRKIKHFNWLIGTGIYLDDIQKELKLQNLKILQRLKKDNKHYLFLFELYKQKINDNYGKIILHQGNSSLKGQLLSLNTPIKRKNKYRNEYLSLLNEYGEGFVTYYYPKGTSSTLHKKMSFFFLIKDLSWVVGTGFYFDDLQKEIDSITKNINVQIENYILTAVYIAIFLSFLTSLVFYFISRKIAATINSYARDIKQSNKDLIKQKNVFKTLYEKSADGIIMLNEGANIIGCNQAVLKILKYKNKDDFLILNVYDISPLKQKKGEKSFEKWNKYIEICIQKKSTNFEWLFLQKNGKKVWCDITLTQIKLDDKTVVHIVLRDISSKKYLESEMQKQQIVLAQQSKKSAMGDMIGNIAHQWRQPLNNVSLLIHYLRDNCLNMNEKEIHKDVENCMIQLNYMSKTIDDFTNFIHPNKAKEHFNLEDTFIKVSTIISAQFNDKNIKISKNIEKINMYGIENELMQVIINILNNSRDALLSNKIENKMIFIDAYAKNEEIIIKIKDNAGGINNAIITRIFEPYFTTKKEHEGVGIGLYMVEEIIEKELNGKILVKNVEYEYENKIFKGAEFSIHLTL